MRPLVVLTSAGFGGFAVLLSVAPLWVVRGGAGEAGAGLVTGVLLLLTILTQPFVPWMLNRFGHGSVLAGGLVALGLPAPLYALSDALTVVLLISAVRGIGFGILTVTGSAVVAELVPLPRRGEAVGVYGLGVAVPNLILLPASVAVADRVGFGWVFALGALPLLGIPAALRLGVTLHQARESEPARGEIRRAAIPRAVLAGVALPAVVLFVVTLSGGGVMTFLPQAVESSLLSSWGLFMIGASAAFSRWWIGRVGDRRGSERLMAPLLLLTAAGLVLTAVAVVVQAELPVLLLVAMALVGLGYGALQNVTLVCAFAQVTARHYGSASAVWNVGFDSGTGLGAVMLGVIASVSDFPTGFVVSAVVVAACIPVSWRVSARPQ